MLRFRQLAQSGDITSLIDRYYPLPEVEGIALGIHGNFIELYRQEFGFDESLNEMLFSSKIPNRWESVCAAAGLPVDLSPIYVVIYVSVDPQLFRQQRQVPEVLFGQYRYALYVEFRERYIALSDRNNHRPFMPGGVSVSGDVVNKAGTLGGFLRVKDDTNDYLLSCFHVLCDGGATEVLQRGRSDGGRIPYDIVGKITHWIPLLPAQGFSSRDPYHAVDAATAIVSAAGVRADPMLRIFRRRVAITRPIAKISLGDLVAFVGKESDRRDVKVYRYIARTKWNWNNNTYNFGDLFEIEPVHYTYFGTLASPGDSGSWVVRERDDDPETLEAFGIVFGGKNLYALCCFMENVFLELGQSTGTTFDYLT